MQKLDFLKFFIVSTCLWNRKLPLDKEANISSLSIFSLPYMWAGLEPMNLSVGCILLLKTCQITFKNTNYHKVLVYFQSAFTKIQTKHLNVHIHYIRTVSFSNSWFLNEKYFIMTKLFYENFNVIYVQYVNIPIKL